MQEGKHVAKAVSVSFGITKNQNQFVRVGMEIVGGPCNGELIDYTGFFTERAAPYAIKALKAMGWTGDNVGAVTVDSLKHTVFVTVQAKVLRNGNTVYDVSWVNPMTGGGGVDTPMSRGQLQDLGTRMRGLVKELSGDATPAKEPWDE